jgi:prophage antirepressor-like protein
MLSDSDLQLTANLNIQEEGQGQKHEEEEEEEETEIDEVQLLFRIWLNERMSPSLLYHHEEIVTTVITLLENQVRQLQIHIDHRLKS